MGPLFLLEIMILKIIKKKACRLSIGSIGVDVVVNVGGRGFMCAETHYPPFYELRWTIGNFKHYINIYKA